MSHIAFQSINFGNTDFQAYTNQGIQENMDLNQPLKEAIEPTTLDGLPLGFLIGFSFCLAISLLALIGMSIYASCRRSIRMDEEQSAEDIMRTVYILRDTLDHDITNEREAPPTYQSLFVHIINVPPPTYIEAVQRTEIRNNRLPPTYEEHLQERIQS